ncbi:unnamed protein product [Rotaria sp. Silwood2]|nr:unnamed protein product [Rotaria sp. Silwood2]
MIFYNSCCNYYLTSSCACIIQVLLGQLFRLLKGDYNIWISILWWCRVHRFAVYSAYLTSTALIILASADRYASSCYQVKYRQGAHVKVAPRLIPIVLIISDLCHSHMLTLFAVNKNEDNEYWALKNTDYRLGFDIGFFIAHGLIFPLLMSTFGFLTICNIRRQQRYSDQQNRTSNLRRYRVRDFQRMTLVQTDCAIIFTLPYVIQKLHRTVTDSDGKSPEEVAWERLSLCIVRVLWVFHDSRFFYIYSLSSVKFRHELFRFLDEHLP